MVDAIINSGEISTFPGQQVMINHKITIKILIKINDKEENVLLLDIQIYISEYCLLKVYDKNNDNQNEKHIDQHKRQRYLQVLSYL